MLVLTVSVAAAASPTTTRVSVSSRGSEASRGGYVLGSGGMSADGRFVLFHSLSPRLVRGDGPDFDVFVRDRRRQTTSLASVRERTAGDRLGSASMSLNGRYVGFSVYTPQPTVPPFFGRSDAYMRDMRTRTTSRLLPSGGGQLGLNSQSPSLSRTGRYVAFVSLSRPRRGASRGRFNIYLRDRERGTTRLISRAFDGRSANGSSSAPQISGNGRYVSFGSNASNLVRHDANGHYSDAFVYDRVTRRMIWTSASATFEYASSSRPARSDYPDLSASGRYVAFRSSSPNLVEGDTNKRADIFIRDLHTDTTQRVSVATGGRQVCVPPPRSWERPCHGDFALSPDGHFVAFSSVAPDLVPGDLNRVRDAFVHDTRTLTTTRASVSAAGHEICGPFRDDCMGGVGAISSGGRFVTFSSSDSGVVADDTNKDVDAFVRGPLRGSTAAPSGRIGRLTSAARRAAL